MPTLPENPNLRRRPLLGLATRLASAFLRLPLRLLRVESARANPPLTIFQCYMVGDFFMALPSIRKLAAAMPVQVVCRPDCEPFLRELGIPAIPFRNAFFLERRLAAFFTTWPAAWRLRRKLGAIALDFDSDPRTGFWLKVAGVRRTVSYARAQAGFFDELLSLPGHCVHQADRDMAIAETYLERFPEAGSRESRAQCDPAPTANPLPADAAGPSAGAPWILSCWTRRDVKNWPLASWDEFLARLAERGVPFQVLDAPDADAAFASFRERWSVRAPFLKGTLSEVAAAVRRAPGVIGNDNFLAHMAGYFGKPVLWINGSSNPDHVQPQGPATVSAQFEPMPCRPCGHRCVNPEYKACLTRLSPETVWRAFEDLRAKPASTLHPMAAAAA